MVALKKRTDVQNTKNLIIPSLRVDPLFQKRKDLRNKGQKLATRFLDF